MNNYLLDTHTLLWYLCGDKRLSNKAKNIICDKNNYINVNIASFWEISIKLSLKKLKLPEPLSIVFEKTKKLDIRIFPIKPEYILRLEKLNFYHKDPFDRIIISNAYIEKIPIITKDINFNNYSIDIIW